MKVQPKIKSFTSRTGLKILVGQDDISNDILTFRQATPNDIWLHVASAPGSHVVLQCGHLPAPDRESLRDAAGLAAWFSKMRTAKKVAVHYALAKQISKPRGAKPGGVTIRRPRKIMVEPRLLPEAAGDDATLQTR